MIDLTLELLPESHLTLEQLWRVALPAVISELVKCGYTVAGTSSTGVAGSQGFAARYQVHPGPASMTAVTDDSAGRIQFVFTGTRFGKRVAGNQTDAVLWMCLTGLGITLSQAHAVIARTTDPDHDHRGAGDG